MVRNKELPGDKWAIGYVVGSRQSDIKRTTGTKIINIIVDLYKGMRINRGKNGNCKEEKLADRITRKIRILENTKAKHFIIGL